MNSHLTPEQVSNWMAGERQAPELLHVRECPRCRAEVERLQAALSAFGGALRNWSDRQSVPKPVWNGRRARPFPLAWMVAAVLLVVALPIYRVDKLRKAERARADEALLTQVDISVSRLVAAPMEPLAKLMTRDENK